LINRIRWIVRRSSLLPSLQDFFRPVKAYIPRHLVADQGQEDFIVVRIETPQLEKLKMGALHRVCLRLSFVINQELNGIHILVFRHPDEELKNSASPTYAIFPDSD
jgi:hypothetical protein